MRFSILPLQKPKPTFHTQLCSSGECFFQELQTLQCPKGTFPEILTQNGGNETADPRGARLSVPLAILNKKPGTRREQNAWVVLQFYRAQAVQI